MVFEAPLETSSSNRTLGFAQFVHLRPLRALSKNFRNFREAVGGWIVEWRKKSSMAGVMKVLREWDEKISKALVAPPAQRNILMWIEFTVNGVPWIAGSSLALVYSASAGWTHEAQHQLVVLNIGLLLDLFASAAIKLTVQRPRPIYNKNDMALEAPVFDRFSFPSGHSSRAAMLAALWIGFYPQYRFAAAGLSFLVAFSRVAMGRHYLSDALAGLALGYIEGFIALAVRPSFSRWLCRILR